MRLLLAIPGVACLLYRAYSKNSLTPLGLIAAAITAIAHTVHPFSLPFSLLLVFFVGATKVTTIKHNIKTQLTTNASGGEGGEGARSHVQVYANTICASILSLLSARHIYMGTPEENKAGQCWTAGPNATLPDILLLGIIINYAAVAADTFSSELGILAQSTPRLLVSWPSFREVPHGTNGGFTIEGLLAGLLGAATIALTTVLILPICEGVKTSNVAIFFIIFYHGLIGTLLDSALGGWYQVTVINPATGKVVESSGGVTVPQSIINKDSLEIIEGIDRLDNNEVNLLSATITSLFGIFMAAFAFGNLTFAFHLDIALLLLGIFITWKVW